MANLRSNGSFELANDTWDGIYDTGGELEAATKIRSIGLEKLRYLQIYRPWDQESAAILEGAIRSLDAAIDQRHVTAEEFYDTAIAEQA